MKSLNLISNSPDETLNIAQTFSKFLNTGNIVVLTGDLGAGKTKFVEGFLKYFGIENEISSPTFNIVNTYNTDKFNIHHFDVYRLADSDEFYAIGGEEYFENGICLIEWGEIIEDILPNDYIQIIFKKDNCNENARFLEFNVYGNSEKYINILNNFKEELN